MDDRYGEPTQRELNQQRLGELAGLVRERMHATQSPIEWSEIELTIPQYRTLHLLVTGPQRMTEVAAALGTSMQATTSLIDRLVEKALVTRVHDTVDRRVVLCHLTQHGHAEVDRIYRIGQARLELLVDVLSDDELELVVQSFSVMAEAALRLQLASNADGCSTEPRGPSVPNVHLTN